MNEAKPEDPAFADLLDDLLTQMLDGEQPDLVATAARHPTVADRIDEALELTCGVAGRRHAPEPSLPGYEILREIGRGGMGTVYLARQTALDRQVALKVLPHSIGLSPRSRPRFLAEARALARVRHDHIVAIHGIVDEGEVLAFEMEFVDGPSLRQLLDHLRAHRATHGTAPGLAQVAECLGLPLAELGARTLTQFFVRLVAKIASALAAVHAAGLIHRDVKPANVLLRGNGQPVLVDFGLVRLSSREISRSGGFAGTPVYASPEQLRDDASIGPAADVYSLGVALYECLTLAPPFAAPSTTDQLRRIENGRLVPLRRAAPGTPRDLETIVQHAMDVDAGRRYPDGGAFADDLQRLLDLQPIQARPAGVVRRAGKFLRRHRHQLLAGALGAALVGAAMVPVFEGVHAAERNREAARSHLLAARQQVFSIDSRHLARSAHRGSRFAPLADEQRTAAASLQTAVDDYQRALGLDPGDRTAERERDVLRLALWLRGLSVSRAETLVRALDSAEFTSLVARLGPFTRATARRLALGTRADEEAPDTDEPADNEDRADAGLLAFLLGDFAACEGAWQTLSPLQRDEPLIAAALGFRYLADGLHDLAYSHLQRAERGFSGSALLRLALAEAALAIGDLEAARHWLAAAGDDPSAALVRQRLELDLRAATEVTDDLAERYADLARRDPGDPTPQHRIAQLAMRRGDLAEAARRLDALVRAWPEWSRFRLDRARVALQQRDLGSYAQQVLAVMDLDYGRHGSRGTVADLLEILRLGGLTELYREGLARTGADATGRSFLGGELPIRAFAPGLAANFVFLLRQVHAVQQHLNELDAFAVEDQAANRVAALPLLVARLPLYRAEDLCVRAVAAAAVPVAPRAWQILGLLARNATLHWPLVGQTGVAVTQVEPPPDLAPSLLFGHALCGIDDRTGDGIAETLVSAAPRDPREAPGCVFVVDGRTARIVDWIEGDGDGDEQMFGYSLASLGDVDGDGAADWLIGAPAGTPDATQGFAEVWSGGKQRRLGRLAGGQAFGVAVAGLGDVDGDGVPDFAVATAPLLRNTAPQGSVDVCSGRTREVLRTLRNDVPGVWFGACIANAGDADGDGCDDLVVGGSYGGRWGGAPGLVRLYSAATGALLHSWNDAAPDHGFGTCVAGAGDLDGDGRADVVVTAVREGSAAGLDQVLCFSGRTGELLLEVRSGSAGMQFGYAVAPYACAGRPPMLAIGAPLGGTSSGAIEFWQASGRPASSLVAHPADRAFGSRLLPIADCDGDGRPELFVSNQAGAVRRIESRGMQFGD